MNPNYDDPYAYYDETAPKRRLSPAAPAVIWGVVMAAAIASAGFTVWRAGTIAESRLVADGDDALRRDFAKLSDERDALAGRIAALERGYGSVRLAQRTDAPETTGSIERASVQPAQRFAVSLGIEPSVDAAKRRWTALAARFPGQLAKLAPLVRKEAGRTPLFDLVAGPFAVRGDAERTCGALAEQGLACDTTDYAGDPIAR